MAHRRDEAAVRTSSACNLCYLLRHLTHYVIISRGLITPGQGVYMRAAARPVPRFAADPHFPAPAHCITHQSLLTTRALLIAGEKILKTGITPSAPTPNAFLIAGVCPTFSPAPHRTKHKDSRMVPFLFDTNERTRKNSTCSKQTRKQFLFATVERPRKNLTYSKQTRKQFLIATFERFPGFLIDTFDDKIAAL